MSTFFNTPGSIVRRGTDQDDIFYPFTNKQWVTYSDALSSSTLWTTSVVGQDGQLLKFGEPNYNVSADLLRGSSGIDTIIGSAANDFLVYNNGDLASGVGAFRSIEKFDLGAGDDFLDLSAHGPNGIAYDLPVSVDASKGNDIVVGGAANDVILGGKGHDVLFGANGFDQIRGGAGDDTIYGGDMLATDNAPNWLFGDEGNDTVYGGAADDFIEGWLGNDRLIGGEGDDEIRGGGGADVIDGGRGNDELFGGDEDMVGAGNDIIHGGDGDDRIFGAQSGFERFYGDAGSDRIVGGQGITWFVYNEAALNGVDTLVRFDQGVDRIVFESLGITRYEAGGGLGTVFAYDVGTGGAELQAVTAAGAHLTIEVSSMLASAFGASDFVFG